MKRAIGFACLALIALGLSYTSSPRLEAQNRSWNRSNQTREGACFYVDANYRGDSFCINAGENLRNVEDRFNDRITSVQVFGGAQVIVYEHENFNGANRTFAGDVSNLQDWNDKITAIQVRNNRTGFNDSGNGPQNGACFYMNADYRGEKFCVNSDESQRNLAQRYNDKISSIRIFGSAEVTVYVDENLNGSRQTVRQDVSNLLDWNWNDKISSFQITGGQYGGQYGNRNEGQYGNRNDGQYGNRNDGQYGNRNEGQYGNRNDGQYGNRGSGYEPRNGACFYIDADYRGDSFCMNAGENLRNVEDRFNDRISSVRVFGRARVVVYEHENSQGSNRAIAGNVSNLLGNFNDKITSIEVR